MRQKEEATLKAKDLLRAAVYRVGGAQAIAALAFGTRSIPRAR
jgi:histidinol dehydrogenase